MLVLEIAIEIEQEVNCTYIILKIASAIEILKYVYSSKKYRFTSCRGFG